MRQTQAKYLRKKALRYVKDIRKIKLKPKPKWLPKFVWYWLLRKLLYK